MPGLCEVADGVNGVIYAARGDTLNATHSLGAMIPFADWASAGVKLTGKAQDLNQVSKVVSTEKMESIYSPIYKDVVNSSLGKTQIQLDLLSTTHYQLGTPNAFTLNMPFAKTDIPTSIKSGDVDVKVEVKNVDVGAKGTDEINYVYFNKTHKDSLPKPKGDGPNGGKLQSHHGLQQEWAKKNLSQYVYDSKLAPTITIETGKELPHTFISNAQTARRNERMASGVGKWSTTLQEELQFMVDDLTKAGFSRNTTSQVLEQQYKMLDKLGVKYERIDY